MNKKVNQHLSTRVEGDKTRGALACLDLLAALFANVLKPLPFRATMRAVLYLTGTLTNHESRGEARERDFFPVNRI